jgi:uncharacterized membrane protein YhhN
MPPSPLATAVVLASAIAAIDWVAQARGSRAGEWLAKPAVILTLIGGVLATGTGSGEAARALLLTALAASLAGDVLLMVPGAFLGGLAAFLVAQLAYLVRLLLQPLELPWLAAGALCMGVVLVAAGRPILRGAASAGLRVPVAGYLVAIAAMALAAWGTGQPAAAAGATLFVISDATLGLDRFVRPASPVGRIVTISTYHVAQVLLVLALAA